MTSHNTKIKSYNGTCAIHINGEIHIHFGTIYAELYLESLQKEELKALQSCKVFISPIEVAIHA